MTKLQQALQALAGDLRRFAAGSSFWGVFADVFGAGYGQSAAHAIFAQLRRGDLSQLARVEVVSAAVLGPAQAAYASANGTIYLSDRFLAEASQAQLQAALLEEIGHAIDARVNASDRPGDEGELFSLRVRGLTPTASERQRLLAEDDRRTITLNGVTVQVEQAAPVVYETTTIAGSSGSSGSGSFGYYLNDIVLSGLNAAWQEGRGRLGLLKFFNGSIVSTIATSAYQSFGDIAISGGTVVYTKSNGAGERGLEVYRTSAGVTTRLTNNTNFDGDLLIDVNTIAWQSYDTTTGVGDIYRHNGTTTLRVTNNTVQEEDVQLSGNNLLWAASDGNDYEIYLLNGANTQQLTNNTLEDYSPVLSGNRAAWLQWNNGQENLFFYNGSATTQVTTNKEVADPMISGGNLIYKQREANGDISLKLYNAGTRATRTLSTKLGDDNIQASGNLIAWSEYADGSDLATLKLFDGTNTTTIASNVLKVASIGDGKVIYIGKTSDSDSSYRGELFLYNSAAPTAGTTQLTTDANVYSFELDQVQIVGNRILWSDGEDFLKLTQPTTKPILSFATPNVTVVEGFTSPQTASLTVSLSAASTVPVTVNYVTFTNYNDDNEADSGSDYTQTTGILTFAAGVTSQTINIPIINDNWGEPDERFYVRLNSPSNAVLVPGSNTASITVSDTLQVTVAAGTTFTLPANVDNLTLTGTTNINGTGNANGNIIRGNSGNNRLDGGGAGGSSGSDQLIGGFGDDTYIIQGTFFNPTITENLNEGTDTVEYTSDSTFVGSWFLGSNLENLVILGTNSTSGYGNALNNRITGNSANNYLSGGAGNDTLDGGAGLDSMYGELGDDTYVVGNTGDYVQEATAAGTDNVQSSITYTLTANVENLTLTGAAAINGSGNDLNNTITGNSGNNSLDGGAGADTMVGGLGDDTYVVDNMGDVVTETSAASTDSVQSSITYTLAANIENLTLTGAAAINGSGNALNNTITGNFGNNTLAGNSGKDSLTGNGGADKFDYRTLNHSLLAGFDRITDFEASLTGDRFLVSTARAGFVNGGQVSTLLTDASLTAAAISTKLTTTNFLANFAATLTMGSGLTSRTFVVINDAVAGFSAASDAVIEVSGFTGSFSTSQFVIS